MMKKLEVQIMGQNYIFSCPQDSQDRLQDAAKKVNDVMCKIRDAGKIKARDRIAVSAALNLAFELLELTSNTSHVQLHPTQTANTPATHDAKALPPATDFASLQSLVKRLDIALGADGHLI